MLRDLFIACFVLGSLPACFRRPYIGLLMFSLLAYMRLQDLAWGFAKYERWSYYVALVTTAGYLSARDKPKAIFELRTVIMLLIVVWMLLGIPFIQGPGPLDWPPYVEYMKIIAVSVFTTAVVQTRRQLRVLVWLIGMCFAFYGVKNGLFGLLTGGGVVIERGPGGMLEDRNDFALALSMAVPILFHLWTSEKNPILKRTVLAMVPLTMVAIVVTHSRGAALSLSVGCMVLVWRSRNRIAGMSVGFLVAVVAVIAAPSEYKDRLSTIANYEEDGSAMGRIDAWKVAGRMIQANPVFGVGMDRFKRNYATYDYNRRPDMGAEEGTRVAHNSYLQIGAENGVPVLLAYWLLIGLTIADLWRIRKEAKRRYHASWILSYATMFEASLFTFLCGGTFLNRAHFDLVYHLICVTIVFGKLAREEMSGSSKEALDSGSSVRSPLRLVSGPGFASRRASSPGLRDRGSLAP